MMKTIKEPARKIPVTFETQVIVVGGGPAGIGAALASARTGAQTILLDRFGCLGGMQTNGNNPIFTFVDPELHSGIVEEIISRLQEEKAVKNVNELAHSERYHLKEGLIQSMGKENVPRRMAETEVGYWGCWGNFLDPEHYKYLLDVMVQEAGINVLYHAFAVGATREENSLTGVIVETNEGRQAIAGKVVIDTTGTGHLAWKAGAPVLGEEGIPTGPFKGLAGAFLTSFFIGGVDLDKFRAYKEANPEEWSGMYGGRQLVQNARSEGAFIISPAVIISPQFDVKNAGRVYVMNPVHIIPKGRKGWEAEEYTKCEMDMRKQAWEVHKMLKANVPGFEKSYIEKTTALPLLGLGHRLEGEHILTVNDMRKGSSFDDAIAINNMPPDLYEMAGRFAYDILPHDVPYRALVSKQIDNLMAAGTTISCGAFASTGLRYCTPSMCTGQAAGTAAALAALNKVSPKKLDVRLVQDNLVEQGAKTTVAKVSDQALEPYRAIKKAKIVVRKTKIDMGVTEDEMGKY